jgi:hypothetical protein
MRVVATAVLLALAAVAGLLAFGSLRWLVMAGRDNSITNYLLIGVPALIATVAAVSALITLWRPPR